MYLIFEMTKGFFFCNLILVSVWVDQESYKGEPYLF